MSESILTSTKKILGLAEDYTAFDLDVITHINSALMVVSQLGIGPEAGVMITDDTTNWDAVTADDTMLNTVKTYVYLRVRLLFDPPTTSYLIKALEDQMRELEWRLNTYRESYAWTEPVYEEDPVTEPVVLAATYQEPTPMVMTTTVQKTPLGKTRK